jgi:hypothetical protein
MAARQIMQEQRRLDPIDRLLLAPAGREMVARFFAVGDTEGLRELDLAVAWAAVLDELAQKTAATGRRVEPVVTTQETPSRPWTRRGHRKPRQDGRIPQKRVITLTEVPSIDSRFSSPYIETLGFAQWGDERIDSDILALDAAIIEIEKALGFSAPDTWAIPEGIPAAYFSEAGGYTFGFRLHHAVTQQAERICARAYSRQSFTGLQENDPAAAFHVLHQAIHGGLLCFAHELACSLLISERPEADNISIDMHIADAEQMATTAREARRRRKSGGKEKTPKQAALDWQDKAAALRQWKTVGQRPSYEKIIERCFDHGNRSRPMPNGPLAGVLRELIFRTTPEGRIWWVKDANKALALRMLPDEAIARAIIQTSRDTPHNAAADGKITGQALPVLKEMTWFEVGDTLRTIIVTGLLETAGGNPCLPGR